MTDRLKQTMNDIQLTDRRTVLKILAAGTVGSSALVGSAGAKPPAATPPFWTPTWGSDETDDWEIVDVSGDVDRKKTKPYTLIPTTAIGEDSFLGQDSHFPGGHDQVVDTPPRNRGAYNVNWHTHNLFYQNNGEGNTPPTVANPENMPYNGKEVLTNSYEVIQGAFDFFLFDSVGAGDIPAPEFAVVSPNDADENRTGGDDYLNTVDQIRDADNNGYANWVGDTTDVPDTDGNGNKLFPHDAVAFVDGNGNEVTYGDIFAPGFFVSFTFVCPVRPTDTGNGNN